MRPSGSCFDRGALVNVLADDENPELLPELARISNAAGLITICSVAAVDNAALERAARSWWERIVLYRSTPALPGQGSGEGGRGDLPGCSRPRGFIPEDIGR